MRQFHAMSFSGFVGALLLVSLYFTNTNFIPLSVFPFVLAPLIAIFSLAVKGKSYVFTKLQFWGGLYYLYSIIGVVIYDYKSLVTYEFYRYDGNFLISFLLLIFIPSLAIRNRNFNERYIHFIKFSIIIALPKVTYDLMLDGVSTGYFIATNAFGGFLMLLVGQCYSTLIERKNRNIVNWTLFFLAVLYLFVSTSRGSMLGVFFGIIASKLMENEARSKWVAILLISIVVVQAIILYHTYPIYLEYGESAIEYAISQGENVKESNVLIRAYENWPRGVFAFLNSPIFGIGVGALNDFPIVLNADSLVQLNASNNIVYDSTHAHHTYLHILGEQGVVGLTLFLMMWVSFYGFIKELRMANDIKRALMITFWALTFASFTEHRIPSPSNCFAFFIIVALAHGERREK